MRPEHWKRLTRLAEAQLGLATVAQIHAIGASRSTLKRAVAAGYLVAVRRGVMAVAGHPPSEWRPLMAAYLAAGDDRVVVSHRAAAGLHRLPGILPGAVDLTSPAGKLRLEGARCHASAHLGRDEVVRVDGFRATSPARTILDLAGSIDRSLLATIVTHACRRRLCSPRDLERQLVLHGGRGRPGTGNLRSVLADRAGGDSGLEDRWLRTLTRAGMRPPALQHQVVVGRRVLLLDFAWPLERVGVEVDGWDVHREREVWDHDHDKVNAYAEAGWKVLFVTSRTPAPDVLRQLHLFRSQKWTSRWTTTGI
ncbi:MAG: type IV toxin-antitoxin system AbiEi family antitoxin domain-containing protein [Actinomycetota bacterium]